MSSINVSIKQMLVNVKSCTHCLAHLPHGVRPVLQVGARAKVLIAGQAPGSRVHASGTPFDDPSGARLRAWMGVDKDIFYDPEKVAILPMGFCYPGKGTSGDLPPRAECAVLWRAQLLAMMPNIELTLLVGRYAINWHLPELKKQSLTNTVKAWKNHWPHHLPIPHPSPRNNIWLTKNDWFEAEVIPPLQQRIQGLLA